MRPLTHDARPRRWSLGLVLSLVDLAAVVLAGLLVVPGVEAGPLALAALAALLVCRGADRQRSRLVLSVLEDLPALLLAAATTTLVLGAPGSWFDPERAHLAQIVLLAAAVFTAMVLLRTAVYAVTHVLRRSGAIAHPVLIVGTGAIGQRLAQALLVHRRYGLVPVGMVDSGEQAPTRPLPLALVGGLDDLDQVMGGLGIEHVVFAFPGPPDEDTISVVRRCVQRDRQVFVVPRFFELMGHDRDRSTELVGGIAVRRLRRTGLPGPTRLVGRAVDVVVSLGGLLVLSPVLAVIAVAVRVETGAGVILHQARVADDGRPFVALTFRSRRPAAFEAGTTTWSFDDDSRIGPVGRLLRRTGLDQLPQLVNVLRGELSLVGVRGGHPAYDEQLRPAGSRATSPDPHPAAPPAPDPHGRLDGLTREHWSWWEDARLVVGAVRRRVLRRPRTARRPGHGAR